MARGVQLKDKAGNKIYAAPYFPIGSIYLSTNKTNPSTYFGGEWEHLYGGYLYAAQSTIQKTSYSGWGTQSNASYTTGSTTLTVDQIPAHTHGIVAYGGSTQWDVGYLWGRASNDYSNKVQGSSLVTKSTGGSSGHTHSIGAHTHNIATVDVFVWKRIA